MKILRPLTILNVIHFLIGTILFLIPIFVIPITLSPFIVPRTFLFLLLVELATFFYLWLVLVRPEYRPKKSYIFHSFIAFVFLSIVSCIVGADPDFSFWSTSLRFDGLLVLLHVFLFFLIVAFTVKSKKTLHGLMFVSAVTAMLVSLSVFFVYLDYAGIGSLKRMFGPYATGGLLGNDSFAGVYLLFNIFFIVYLILNSQNRYKRYMLESFLILILLSPIFFNFDIFKGVVSFGDLLGNPSLLFGVARGATVGTAIGLIATVLLLFLNHTKKSIRVGFRVTAGLFFVTLVTFVAMIFIEGNSVHKWFGEKTQGFRFVYWQQAVEGIKERPVLGWGTGNFILVNEKYYDASVLSDANDLLGTEKSSDKAHNIIFDMLVTTGILGFLAYVTMLISSLVVLWRAKKVSNYNKAVLSGLLLAYVLQNLVFFDVLVSYIMFAFLLAIILILERDTSEPSIQNNLSLEPKNNFTKIVYIILPLIFILLVLSLKYFVLLPAKEAYLNHRFYDLPREVRPFYESNRNLSNFGTSRDVENHAFFAFQQYLMNMNYIKTQKNLTPYIADIDNIIHDVVKNSKNGEVTFMGAHTISQLYSIRYQLLPDDSSLPKMRFFSERQMELSPKDTKGYIDRARVYFYEKNYVGALDVLEKAFVLNRYNVRIHAIIIDVAKTIGDKKLLEEKISRAEKYLPNFKFR
ncbi:MAG: O-antigen ligase family protein [bacterium]|nr:O-antigen ligase family protein [bacterium]